MTFEVVIVTEKRGITFTTKDLVKARIEINNYRERGDFQYATVVNIDSGEKVFDTREM